MYLYQAAFTAHSVDPTRPTSHPFIRIIPTSVPLQIAQSLRLHQTEMMHPC